jgi:hypothetical protein
MSFAKEEVLASSPDDSAWEERDRQDGSGGGRDRAAGAWEPLPVVEQLRARGYEVAAIDTLLHAVDLFDCLVFGREVEGVRPGISARCDTHVRIPMLGTKHSLSVTAGRVAIYELLRKYRALRQVTMNRA